MKKAWIIWLLLSVSAVNAKAQCPDKSKLWSRLVDLSSGTAPANNELLKELITVKQQFRSCPDPVDSSYAFLLQRIGATYFKMGEFIKAAEYVREAVDFNRKFQANAAVNYGHNVRNYFMLSVFYDSLQNHSERIRSIDSCLSLGIRRQSTETFFLYGLLKRIISLFNAGEYQRALDLTILGEQRAEHLSPTDRQNYLGSFFGWRINVLTEFRQFDLAEKLLNAKMDSLKAAHLTGEYSTLYQQKGRVQLARNDIEGALKSYLLAADAAKQSGLNLQAGQAHNNVGFEIYYSRKHQNDSALKHFKTAIRYFNQESAEKEAIKYEKMNAYANIANTYFGLGKTDSATTYFQLAFDQLSPGIDEKDLITSEFEQLFSSKNENAHYLISLVLDKADLLLQQYKKARDIRMAEKALSTYHSADILFERIKREHFAIKSKLFWSSNARRLYENGIESALAVNKLDDVFYFFERSRAVLLSEELNEYRGMASADIQSMIQLRKKVAKGEKQMGEVGANTNEYRALQNQVLLDKQQLDALSSKIKANNPVYYQGFFDSSFITVQQVREQLLFHHKAFVEFFMGDQNVYVLVITPADMFVRSMPAKSFITLATTLTRLISDPRENNERYDEFINLSRHLYNNLFGEKQLPSGRIAVSPDGTYFPLEILVTGISARKPVYLVQRNAISYTYSARFLLNRFDSEKANTNTTADFLGIAPVNFSRQTSLPALIGSDQSLNHIGPFFEERNTFTGTKATRNNFLDTFSDYKVIQLYTHAADSSNTGEPAIYFSDSTLYLSDLIADKQNGARLIVLSACETAKGKFHVGEGIFSFNRGFAAIGIPSAVTNLWAVDDQSTYELTEAFYKYLSQGKAPDLALQSAKLEFLAKADKERELPYYWAASILTGKSDPITFTHHFPWEVVIAGLAIIVFGILIYSWRKYQVQTGRRHEKMNREIEKDMSF